MLNMDDLLITESTSAKDNGKDDDVEEACDAQHKEITSPDDASGVKDNDGGKLIEKEGFIWYESDETIGEANIIDGDPFEFIVEAMYQNVINANNIAIAVLADKYTYVKENGVEMLDEGVGDFFKKRKDAIGRWFKKAKEKVSAFFDTVIQKMVELQAKFYALFKKAKVQKNFIQVQAPDYTPEDVQKKALAAMDMIEEYGDTSVKIEVDQSRSNVSFSNELDIIKNYGTTVKKVKEFKKTTLKLLDSQCKYELHFIDDEEKKKSNTESYAKKANAVIAIAKEALSLIMKRVNIAAKSIIKAAKYKDDKATKAINKQTKAKQKDKTNDYKHESASYLDGLDMI